MSNSQSIFAGIDLSSDTATRPTQAMREAIGSAVVGDEQKGEDPTTLELEQYAAALLGHDLAMFLPSATMANEIAIMLHCGPGDEILASDMSHIVCAEVGGPAVHGRAMVRGISSDTGIFTPTQVEAAVRLPIPHAPRARMILVENTANLSGGHPWPLESLGAVLDCGRKHGMRLHCDGARLMNAAVATGVSAKQLVQGFDTVTLCLSKGLGAPMGAVLVGRKEFLEPARRFKHLMGGAMRQSGMMAAAGLHALKNNIQRLACDHENARFLAEGLLGTKGLVVENQLPASNMVFMRLDSPRLSVPDFLATIAQKGVRFSQVGHERFRAVTHLDVSKEQIAQAIRIVRDVGEALDIVH